MNKVSLIDEDIILMSRISNFLMYKEKYIVISKNLDEDSFLKNPPLDLNIIITNLLPNYLEKINPYKSLKKEFP
jgi:hypothetical protein